MQFGIYIHTQGPSLLREVARELHDSINKALLGSAFQEIDGLFMSYQSVSSLAGRSSKPRRKVRHDYSLRLITGGTEHYKCMVEYDARVADAEIIEASESEHSLFEYVRALILLSLPPALDGLNPGDLATLQLAASAAELRQPARW